MPEPSSESLQTWICQIADLDYCKSLVITGGEPFIVFRRLLKVVEQATHQGVSSFVQTSSFFGQSHDQTHKYLAPLAAAGLKGIGVSVDHYHQRYVPISSVRRVIEVGKGLGLWIGLAYRHDTPQSMSRTKSILMDLLGPQFHQVDTINSATVQSWIAAPDIFQEQADLCTAISPCIWPDGCVLGCCGPAPTEKTALMLGSLKRESLKTIMERYHREPILRMLETIGLRQMIKNYGAATGQTVCSAFSPQAVCSTCQYWLSVPEFIAFQRWWFERPEIQRQIMLFSLVLHGRNYPIFRTQKRR